MPEHRRSPASDREVLKRLPGSERIGDRKRVSRSSVVDAAQESSLSPDTAQMQETALTRRLDRLSRQVARIERDLGISAETLGLFVRFRPCQALPVHPERHLLRLSDDPAASSPGRSHQSNRPDHWQNHRWQAEHAGVACGQWAVERRTAQLGRTRRQDVFPMPSSRLVGAQNLFACFAPPVRSHDGPLQDPHPEQSAFLSVLCPMHCRTDPAPKVHQPPHGSFHAKRRPRTGHPGSTYREMPHAQRSDKHLLPGETLLSFPARPESPPSDIAELPQPCGPARAGTFRSFSHPVTTGPRTVPPRSRSPSQRHR